ncbi:MAG: tryptophan synthase subunit beta [Verrucomicrobiota bacterium]|jgi:tryptophan synthase beta subunit
MIPSATPQSIHQSPNAAGFFGNYGGIFVPPELEAPLAEIRQAYEVVSRSHDFIEELRRIRRHFQGRPTPVYHAARLSKKLGRTQIYLKREDLNHTGAHKLNHCMGEALLARFMGKKKLIAETGAGMHGVALATAAAYFGMECDIYMGEVDIAKQAPNVARMQILGARVIPATHGLRTLKEAVDAALTAYVQDPVNQIYCIGSVVGPHPFPMMVRDFQQVVGIEAREQIIEMTGNLPDIVTACVGGGSNAMGIFTGFIDDPVELHGVEPLGKGTTLGEHSATMTYGMEGVIHGFRCYLLQDEKGEPAPVHSIASGLDYPGVGPEHCHLKDTGRVRYVTATDQQAVEAFYVLSRNEGIIPALESAHAIAHAMRLARENPDVARTVVVNLSGRGDKDMDYMIEHYGTGGDFAI